MKFWEIFWFEFTNQVCRAPVWIFTVALFGITMWMSVDGLVGNARSGGYLFNGPFIIISVTVFGNLLGLLVPAFLAGNAAARDLQVNMDPLMYTTTISKSAYLGGRFIAAFVLYAIILLIMPVGHLIATLLPGLEPELLGPLRLDAYFGSWFLFSVPNAFLATAFLFALAIFSRRAITSYLGSIILLFGTLFCWVYLAGLMGQWDLAKLLDPIGNTIVAELSRVWAPAEKSNLMVTLEGSLLFNRIIWIGVALTILVFTYLRFRFSHSVESTKWWILRRHQKKVLSPDENKPDFSEWSAPIAVPNVIQMFGLKGHIRQTLTIAGESIRSILFGWGGLIMIFLALILLFSGPGWMQHMGVPLFPTTERIVGFLGNSQDLLFVVIPLLIVFYAGELVWRERDAGMHEITDAVPHPEWVPFLGKFIGLSLMLVVLQALMMLASIFIQISMEYYQFEIGVYLQVLFGVQLINYLLFAMLTFSVHIFVDHKYLGHMISLIAFGFMTFAAEFSIGHNLLIFGSDPGWTYSDMRGFDPFIGPLTWFKIYWVAWAIILALNAKLFWVRGKERGFRQRFQKSSQRFTPHTTWTAATAGTLILIMGSFIFYNTNIVNNYRSDSDVVEHRAEYERRYGHYDGISQPRLTSASLEIDIYPTQRKVSIRGTYNLVNKSDTPIDSVHLATSENVETRIIKFNRYSRMVLADNNFGHRIHQLEQALQPEDTLQIYFEVDHEPKGFPSSGIPTSVAANGSFFEPENWMPAIGYQRSRELSNAGDRRIHGLEPRPAIRSLNDIEARYDLAGEERINFEAVVSTEENQIALAPGDLQRTWNENGRRYFQYKTNAPIRNDFAIFSADYAVHQGNWGDVSIEIFHHPGHNRNLKSFTSGIEASLDYYSEHIGSYPYSQIRLAEHPGRGLSLHAYPINISYSEGFSLMNPSDDPRDLAFPFAVIAHEVAHQWWGNLVTPANVEGAPLLTESLAWYSALGVVENTYGSDHLRRLLGVMREAYITPHSRAGVPLLQSYDWLQANRKGPFVMYALREYVGEERVISALRKMVEKFGLGEPPLPVSMDLYGELQAVTPDSLQYLLVDLFEENTWWELETKQVKADSTLNGDWEVTIDVASRKMTYDTLGKVTDLPLNDWIEIGIFAPGEGVDRPVEPIYLQKHKINREEQTIKLTVPRKPGLAGIDPYHLLMDVNSEDNFQNLE